MADVAAIERDVDEAFFFLPFMWRDCVCMNWVE